jgi:hypothetical protein
MSALGQDRPFSRDQAKVRFAPIAVIREPPAPARYFPSPIEKNTHQNYARYDDR